MRLALRKMNENGKCFFNQVFLGKISSMVDVCLSSGDVVTTLARLSWIKNISYYTQKAHDSGQFKSLLGGLDCGLKQFCTSVKINVNLKSCVSFKKYGMSTSTIREFQN